MMPRHASVAILLPNLRGGGVEQISVKLANTLARITSVAVPGYSQGEGTISVDLLLFRAEGEYLQHVSAGVRIVDLKARRALTAIPGIVRYLLREHPHALLSAQDHVNVIALLCGKLAGLCNWIRRGKPLRTRLVVAVHEALRANMEQVRRRKEPRTGLRMLAWSIRHTFHWADAVIAVSRGVADDLAETAAIDRGNIRVIYNPVLDGELEHRINDPVPHRWLAPGEPPVVLGVGRFYPQKDFETLIQAFSLVREKRPARLLIFGEGPLRAAYESLIARLRLERDAALPGFTDRPLSAMAHAGVFVLSSAWEALPTVLVEAVACGAPVVSTRCPHGPSEILENGGYGALVEVGDVEGMASAILSALERGRCAPAPEFMQRFSAAEAAAEYARVLLADRAPVVIKSGSQMPAGLPAASQSNCRQEPSCAG